MGRPPVLVLGLGNLLLADDAVGLELLERLAHELPADARVELVDGGTQGLALLGPLAGRRAALLLDAVALGAPAGTVHALGGLGRRRAPHARGAHEGGAPSLLAAAALTGDLPDEVELVGVEPLELETRIGLSPPVRDALPAALASARERLAALLERFDPAPEGVDAALELPGTRRAGRAAEAPCTS